MLTTDLDHGSLSCYCMQATQKRAPAWMEAGLGSASAEQTYGRFE